MLSSSEFSGNRSWQGNGGGRGRGGFGGMRGSFQGSYGRSGREGLVKGKRPQFSSPEPALGSLLSTLSQTDFNTTAGKYESDSSITDCVTVTSYNWLDRAEPTIAVPGKPAKWTPLVAPRQLKPDDGQYFRDPNAAHHPKHPMEPMILAVLAQSTHDAIEDDVVACGSTLGNLLRFIRGEDKQFRILVELVEGAVFFIRRENTPRELIPDVKGYGHSFPEAYTTWDADVKGSVSHQRIISYRFGDLRFLMRFEGDGYIQAGGEDKKTSQYRPSELTDVIAKDAVDGLTAALDQSRMTAAAPSAGSELTVSSAGKLVNQECVFDLKTRSIRRKEVASFEDTFAEQLPRLWVAQIPQFILAYHDRGTFEDITVKDTRKDVKAWERQQVDVLSRLAALIHHIINLVKSRPDGKLELRHVTVGTLEVREQLADAGDALSDAVRDLWAKERGTADGVSSERKDVDGGEHRDYEEEPEYNEDAFDWDDRSEPDFTACSADHCGYCGRCSY
ncbi:hypothetical protein N8I77_012372 [Diaporthe amygdali]|uniref:Geranylgeranyl pyrophosphate synthetase n=1 Tax=Phomopsis amygdali TaxID=1214568 RepID=A0AAD9S408_PHOAM|nr:hypothetical protein N8I77_012372 [Diaporthe amygdali]